MTMIRLLQSSLPRQRSWLSSSSALMRLAHFQGGSPWRIVAGSHVCNLDNHNSNQRLASTSASSTTTLSSKLVERQRELWEDYLATGRGGAKLFQSIDTNSDGVLSPGEIQAFLNSIQAQVPPRAWRVLETTTKEDEEPLSLKDFKRWLIVATKFSTMKNTQIKSFYESNPELGPVRRPPVKTENVAAAIKEAAELAREVAAVEDKEELPEFDDDDDLDELDAQEEFDSFLSRDMDELYTWNELTMSQSLRRMQYAVRGQVVMKADVMKAEGRSILFTNIGNPHAVGQSPITFYRQVLALCDLPAEYGVDHPNVNSMFPPDVVERARELRDVAVGECGTGAYTHSQGMLKVRQDIAEFIKARDSGHEAYAGNIFLTNGASDAIDMILTALIAQNEDAIMIPIPQYPIYSALIARLGGRQVGYYLDESLGWAAPKQELYRSLLSAKAQGLRVKGLALINPGNPTGQVLARKDLEEICLFCAKHGIVLLADEVYQRNVYVDDKPFVSAKQVAVETPGCETLQLVSFHSTSKGLIGECGRRGGYMELHHIDPYVQTQLYKLASASLCSNVPGQLLTSLMLRPPEPGSPSYDLFMEEESSIFGRLKRNAKAVVEGLNSIDGIECAPAEGAMYAFPRITNFPAKAIHEAEAQDMEPDVLYALSLLEETGICVVPASGFGQAEGRAGFRTTFLPHEHEILPAIDRFAQHHKHFCEKYS